jgi:Uma2 family endonuclease
MSIINNNEIIYPYSDGTPIAESDITRDCLFYCVEALDIYFQNRADVYVSANLFIYYTKGEPSAVVAPDVFVVFGVTKKKCHNYKLWEENNKAPNFVMEITSESTQQEDQIDKAIKYASLGVTEYFQYDPHRDYLNPNLKGFRLNPYSTYELMQQNILADGTFSIHSDVLNLDLRLISDELRFFDPQTGNKLLSYEERYEARIQAEQLLKASKARLKSEQQGLEFAKASLKAEQQKLEEIEKALNAAVPKLFAMGLSVEQVALALSWPVEKVRRLIKE